MNLTESKDQAHLEAKKQLSGLGIVKPESASGGFQYGYLPRLIDDRELELIEDAALRSATRDAHRQVYWKSIRLLSRDVRRIRENRRKLMDVRQEWSFESLIADTARIWRLLLVLRVAGAAHSLHVPGMVNVARNASAELQILVTAPLRSFSSVPAVHAT